MSKMIPLSAATLCRVGRRKKYWQQIGLCQRPPDVVEVPVGFHPWEAEHYWKVVVKYSLTRRYNQYAGTCAATGWCMKILERYLRMSRFTCLTRKEYRIELLDICKRLARKHHTCDETRLQTYAIQQIPCWDSEMPHTSSTVWVSGRRIEIGPSQRSILKKLNSVRTKAVDLERRMGRVA